MTETRKVAVVAGNRIPFARQDKTYRHASNSDMLTAALNGLVDRTGLGGEELGEVVAGAVLLAAQAGPVDQAVQGGSEHVGVGGVPVGLVLPGERDPVAGDNSHLAGLGHDFSPALVER